jgi:uncharacterized protein YndB with AHSA1/START domain
MSANPSVATKPGKPSLTIKRRLNAPAAKVYAAWTEPEKIAAWFGPEGVVTVRTEMDVRVGGRFRIVMRAPDGEEHDVSGDYREVVPNERLVFSWAWRSTPERDSLVTVTLKADGDGTILTLLHEQFFDELARDRHNFGWTGAIDKLERLFA